MYGLQGKTKNNTIRKPPYDPTHNMQRNINANTRVQRLTLQARKKEKRETHPRQQQKTGELEVAGKISSLKRKKSKTDNTETSRDNE